MKNIYLLTIDWATDDDANTTVSAYANFEDAKADWENHVLGVHEDPQFEDVTNPDGSIAEEWEDTYEALETREGEELFYEIYQEGYYCSGHYMVKVQKLEIIGA